MPTRLVREENLARESVEAPASSQASDRLAIEAENKAVSTTEYSMAPPVELPVAFLPYLLDVVSYLALIRNGIPPPIAISAPRW